MSTGTVYKSVLGGGGGGGIPTMDLHPIQNKRVSSAASLHSGYSKLHSKWVKHKTNMSLMIFCLNENIEDCEVLKTGFDFSLVCDSKSANFAAHPGNKNLLGNMTHAILAGGNKGLDYSLYFNFDSR